MAECPDERTSLSDFIRKSGVTVTFEYIQGFYKNPTLLYVKEEQQFYKGKPSNPSRTRPQPYLCYVDGCRCRVNIHDGKCFIAGRGSHNHENNAQMYINLKAFNEMRQKILNSSGRLKSKQVFTEVMKRYVFIILLLFFGRSF